MSDAQTARIAVEYAKDPLLKHFSIPRLKLEDVEMELNVSLDKISDNIATKADPIDNTKLNSLVYKEVVAGLGVKSLSLPESRTLRAEIAKRTQTLEREINMAADTTPIKDFAATIAAESLSITRKAGLRSTKAVEPSTDSLSERLERAIRPAISLTEVKSRDLNVIAESKQLAEEKPECFIKVKMKITETGLEWARVLDANGNEVDKLIPE